MERLPISAKILLVGGFLPLGLYGMLRFALVVLTDAAAAFAVVMAAAGLLTLFSAHWQLWEEKILIRRQLTW